MSKTTPQCDELRTMAEGIGLAMPQAATLMMESADTICELRKLAHDLLQPILAEGFDCYGCVYEDDCEGMRYTDRCMLLDRAQKLGVER